MNLFGIPLRKPSFNEVTAATVMAIGLWLLVTGLMRAGGQELGATDAGAALLVCVWSCVGARIGIRIGLGARHLAANLVVSGALLLAYEGAQRALA
jgi:hypothetical protein